jgi:hypothetical protein
MPTKKSDKLSTRNLLIAKVVKISSIKDCRVPKALLASGLYSKWRRNETFRFSSKSFTKTCQKIKNYSLTPKWMLFPKLPKKANEHYHIAKDSFFACE